MAEPFGIAAGALTVIELTAKIIKRCHHLIQTAQDAPKEIRHIFVEISSLKAIFESFHFLLDGQSEYSEAVRNLGSVNGTVQECQSTVEDLVRELDGISLSQSSETPVGKREMLKGSLKWCLKQTKAHKILHELGQHKATITLALLDDVTRDVKDIKSIVNTIQESLTDAEKGKACKWIEHTNPTSNHDDACKLHESDTCRWISRVEQWSQWLSRHQRMIWIHGIPGAGKTVLASYLIEHVKAHCKALQSDRSICLYYYCSYIHNQDETKPFLRWIVSQLCRRFNYVPLSAATSYRSNQEPSLEDLEDTLKDLFSYLDVLYIIVDAVDESIPREDFLKLLQVLACDPAFTKIQLLVTSRNYADIDSVLRPLAGTTIPMSNAVVDEDIRIYVNVSLQGHNFKRWPKDLCTEVEESLVRGAKGMFRWVVCQLDRLYRKRSLQDIRTTIRQLPETLDETYERIFLEIPRDDWPAARSALLWICAHDDLPFRHGIPSNCLRSAMLRAGKDCNLQTDGAFYDEERPQEILGCLVQVQAEFHRKSEGNVGAPSFRPVSLAHYTVQEYLYSTRIAKSSASYFAMSKEKSVREVLPLVLNSATEVEEDCSYLIVPFYRNFERYCYEIARIASTSWEDFIIDDEGLFSIFESICSCQLLYWDDEVFLYDLVRLISQAEACYRWGEPSSEMSRHAQIIHKLCSVGSFKIAAKILAKLDVHTILSAPLDYISTDWWRGDKVATSTPGHVTIADALGAISSFYTPDEYYGFIDILRKRTNKTDALLYCLGAHYHEFTCMTARGCIISEIVGTGVDVNAPGLAILPLQIAVHHWDFAGTELLLKVGANPNEIGQVGGHILAHIDTAWGASSALHILRNAEYGFMNLEFCTGMYETRKKRWSELEQLLISYGARDFNDPTK